MAKLVRQTAPYIRLGAHVNKMMLHVLISLIPVTAFAIYRFGLDAVLVILTSIVSMCLVEFLYYKLKKQPCTLGNLSAVISGLIFALTLSSETPLYVVAVVGGFSIFVTKLMFGGLGNNIFNVAAVARAIVAVSFASQVTYAGVDTTAGGTALQVLSNGGAYTAYSISDLFTGMAIPGSMGEISALCILVGAIYLIVMKAADWRIMVSYTGFFAIFSLIYGIIAYQDAANFTLFSLFSGAILFGAVYMATDPVTSPVLNSSKIFFGFGLAAVNFLIRYFGALPEGTTFSIILMNMFVPFLETPAYFGRKLTSKNIIALVVLFAVMVLLIVLGGK